MSKTIILDGALGTQLQKHGLQPGENTVLFGFENREILKNIHKSYVDAGSDIILCNSFSINPLKIKELNMPLDAAVKNCIEIAREATMGAQKKVKVAFDMSTLGQLIEPMGTLTFEDAYEAYRETAISAEKHKADLIIVETMTDLYELKAAVLAIKENTSLPVYVSMTFEKNGRTFTGVSLETMVATLEGLQVDAIGINCSLGPVEIYPLAERLSLLTDLPILIKPNAGLPDPATGEYNIDIDEFASSLATYRNLGISMVGGCCGTEATHISKLVSRVEDLEKEEYLKPAVISNSIVCSGTKTVDLSRVCVVGERLNPTGKKRLQQALLDEDWDYVLTQAIEQIDAGADILDVNVGVPGLNQVEVLPKVIKKIQSITDTPLQIDSSNPKAIEAALRVYNGKAIVNSVNGEEKSLEEILPIVKKYGAAVIGLTLDEDGIPKTAEKRVEIAEKILSRALSYGIKKEDVYVDCLTLTASAEQAQAVETLKAVEIVTKKLGLKTTLGVSNISFGLPNRQIVNRTFLTLAMEAGLTLPIIDPNSDDMMSSIYAFNLLKNNDANSSKYIDMYSDERTTNVASNESLEINQPGNEISPMKGVKLNDTNYSESANIGISIEKGLKESVSINTKELLKTESPLAIINNHLIPALDKVGKGFEKGTIYLPQMIQSAVAAQGGFDVIKDYLANTGESQVSKGKVALATVKGDIHDIGKNIVKVIMENYGFDIIDLGKDVPIERVVETVKKHDLKLVGLSALMTTTLESMEATITEIKAISPNCKVMVGGAVLTEEYSKKIGADFYCKDALASVEAGNTTLSNS